MLTWRVVMNDNVDEIVEEAYSRYLKFCEENGLNSDELNQLSDCELADLIDKFGS